MTYVTFQIKYDGPGHKTDKFEYKIIEKNGKRKNETATPMDSFTEEVSV